MEKYCKQCGRVFKSTRTGRQSIPRKLRHQVFQRDGYRCRECGATNKQTRLHVDHIKPVAKGGTNDLNNLQTLCEECNKAKYTDEWVGGEKESVLEYNKRIERNEERGKNYFPPYTKRCPNCNTLIYYDCKKCVKCGHVFWFF